MSTCGGRLRSALSDGGDVEPMFGRLTAMTALGLTSVLTAIPAGAATATRRIVATIWTDPWWLFNRSVGTCPSDCAVQIAADAIVRAAEDAVVGVGPPADGTPAPLLKCRRALGRRMAIAAEPLLP